MGSCDNCKGSFEDISTRMEEFKQRLFYNGWERTKAVWTVPQGFGGETYVHFADRLRLAILTAFHRYWPVSLDDPNTDE
jgi:hypothetical protein